MAKAPGLYRPDGQPVRQFGEEIVESGKPFSGDTLAVIRSLVSDHALPPSESDTDAVSADERQQSSKPVPELPSHPHRDPLPDPLPDEQLNPIRLNLAELDTYATDHLRTMQAMQEAAAVSPPPPKRPPDDATARHPPQLPSVRDSWRQLVIVEGRPGRSLRSTLQRPRFWATLLLLGLIAWRPWAIPFMVLTIAMAVILFVLLAGADRVAEIAGWGYARLKKRDPARAERLLRRGNRFLTKVEWLADRLPPSWVEGFHVPDLEAATAPPTDDGFLKSRLARIAAEETGRPQLAKGT